MKRAIGPIVSTGMALVVAGVIVANPVLAPRADVQIPAITLSSGSGEAGGMLDKAFLDAIAPAPPESSNPFTVLRDLFSSLASGASDFGKNAIVEAFVAGVTAVSEPELTAAWSPYVAPPEISAVAASVLPGLQYPLPAQDVSESVPAPAAVAAGALPAEMQEFVNSLVHDVGYVGGEVISAAFAVGAVVAAEPVMIAETLRALVNGDLAGALSSAVKVVIAPLGPTAMVVEALRTVVEKRLAELTVPAVPQIAAAPSVAPLVEVPRTTAVVTPPASALGERPARRGAISPPAGQSVAPAVPTPAAAVSPAADPAPTDPEPVIDRGQIRRGTTTSAETAEAPVTRRTAVAAREAAKAVGEQIGAALDGAADAVGRAAGRAGAGRAGSAAE